MIVSIEQEELDELRRKAELYDKMVEARRRGAMKTNSISKEALSARNKKASMARWNKIKTDDPAGK
jgi:hypothetical protein